MKIDVSVRPKKKNIIISFALAMAILLCATVVGNPTFARYFKNASVGGTMLNSAYYFSSDVLKSGGTTKQVSIVAGQAFSFHLYNYAYPDNTRYAARAISYSWSATVSGGSVSTTSGSGSMAGGAMRNVTCNLGACNFNGGSESITLQITASASSPFVSTISATINLTKRSDMKPDDEYGSCYFTLNRGGKVAYLDLYVPYSATYTKYQYELDGTGGWEIVPDYTCSFFDNYSFLDGHDAYIATLNEGAFYRIALIKNWSFDNRFTGTAYDSRVKLNIRTDTPHPSFLAYTPGSSASTYYDSPLRLLFWGAVS